MAEPCLRLGASAPMIPPTRPGWPPQRHAPMHSVGPSWSLSDRSRGWPIRPPTGYRLQRRRRRPLQMTSGNGNRKHARRWSVLVARAHGLLGWREAKPLPSRFKQRRPRNPLPPMRHAKTSQPPHDAGLGRIWSRAMSYGLALAGPGYWHGGEAGLPAGRQTFPSANFLLSMQYMHGF
jgi:hypothetical protein